MMKPNVWALKAMKRVAETTAKIMAVFMVIDPLELEDTVKITVPIHPMFFYRVALSLARSPMAT